jgi:hypothetical protein
MVPEGKMAQHILMRVEIDNLPEWIAQQIYVIKACVVVERNPVTPWDSISHRVGPMKVLLLFLRVIPESEDPQDNVPIMALAEPPDPTP